MTNLGLLDPDARRALGVELARAAIAAADAHRATDDALEQLVRDGVALDGCVVFAFGKCAPAMAEAALARVRVARGIAIVPETAPPWSCGGLEVRKGGHPVPRADACETGEALLDVARSLGPADTALCLVSGGGSAMLELPIAGVGLDDIASTTRALLRAGATIAELNAVRQRLSRFKGGKLARAMGGARIVNVLISDVVGHPPSVVASGPTLLPGAMLDARAVVERYALSDLPASVRDALARDEPALPSAAPRITTVVAADNRTARRGVVDAARAHGLTLLDHAGVFEGEAREVGARFAAEARAMLTDLAIDGVVWGGETTVTVVGDGRGGRNEELALGALETVGSHLLVAVGTDGVDGTSDAAGGLADGRAAARARELGLDPADALARNDADAFLRTIDARIVTGPTGTNVADVAIVLR